MQNVEFKAELRDLGAARRQCKLLGAQCIGTLQQTDTYFRLGDGRLKRREAPGEPVEWIYYHRDDRVAPRLSVYSRLTDEQARRRWGTQSLKPWLVVEKTRELWMLEHIRIHLDDVKELGTFVEFEAVVSRANNVKQCHADVVQLREQFAPVLGESISVSYSDLKAQMQTDRA